MARSPSSSHTPTGTGTPQAAGPRFSSGPSASAVWEHRRGILSLEAPRILGVLNLTPDSFSDGGELGSVDEGLARAEALLEAGADVLDVGGESTRPGAPEVPAAEEAERILPFVREAARRFDAPISVDTRKAEVARRALDAGASIVNDVSGLAHDPEMAEVVAAAGAGVVVMHMRGTPETMSERTGYDDVVEEVLDELGRGVERAREAGVPDRRIVVDPGIGFAKTPAQSLTLIRETGRFLELGFPVLVGPSRKSFLGAVLDLPVGERLEGTLAACVLAYAGGARLFRVHDVEAVGRSLRVARAVMEGTP